MTLAFSNITVISEEAQKVSLDPEKEIPSLRSWKAYGYKWTVTFQMFTFLLWIYTLNTKQRQTFRGCALTITNCWALIQGSWWSSQALVEGAAGWGDWSQGKGQDPGVSCTHTSLTGHLYWSGLWFLWVKSSCKPSNNAIKNENTPDKYLVI